MNDLPIEILMKIFNYLPNHKSVALVNHRFYDAVCTLDDPLIRLGVFPNFINDHKNQEYLESILNTTRNITNILVSFLVFERPVVIAIIKKFAQNINYLRVFGRSSDLIEAVYLVPNMNHLELVLLDEDTQRSKKARLEIQNEELNLLMLKKLNIERSKHEFIGMFNRLPADVLIELTLHQESLSELVDLFKFQTKIKKLMIMKDEYGHNDLIIDADLFDNLQLEFLELHAYSFEDHSIRLIIAKQTDLKVLKLIGKKIDVELMNALTNQLSKLETLSIPVSNIPVSAFKSITKLENLTKLTLQSNDEENVTQLQIFAALDNSRITSLNIEHYYDISDDLINAMAKSLPNLKNLSFHCDNNVNTFHSIMKHFNYVQVLHLDALYIEFDDQKGNISSLMRKGCANNNLIELKISYPLSYTMKFVQKMVKDYPNLKKLIMIPTNRNITKQFEAILKEFKKMELFAILRNSLSLDRRVYDLSLIRKYGKNLRFVALLDMNIYIPERQIEENFKNIFGVIECSMVDGLKMAVDRKTMQIEGGYIERC